MTCSGVPFPSQTRWCLLPVFRRSTGGGPVAASPFFRADVGAVHARTGPVEFAGRLQLREQDAEQLIEGSSLLPAVRVAPAGLSRAVPRLQRQELSRDVLVQDVLDALQAQPVLHRFQPRRPLGPTWQQWLDQRPQVVVHDPWSSRHIHPTVRSLHQSRLTIAVQQDPVMGSCVAS